MAEKLTVSKIKEEWSSVELTKGIPIKYSGEELWFPRVYIRLAGMDDILSIRGLTEENSDSTLDAMLKMIRVLSSEGCRLENGVMSDPVYPESSEILSVYLANIKRRDVKPKDFNRVAKAFKIVNDLEEEDPKDFLKIPGQKIEELEIEES